MNGFNQVLAPIQNSNELARWIQRVATARPKVVVEIGTAKGGTFFLLSRASDLNATMVSIDLPGGLYGGGYPRWKQDFYRKLIGDEKAIHFVRANSHDSQTRAKLEEILGDRRIDVLFIDGDHSYEGVKRDFSLYGPLVRPGGLIGLHDILENRFDKDIDVHRFWDEVKQRFVSDEIVDRADQGLFGIGVVVVPEAGLKDSNT
jgi:predicted O-methyltransferase YrrM